MLVHGAALLVLLLRPGLWQWSLLAVLASQAAVAVAVFSPRSALLGPVLARLPDAAVHRGEVAITIDDGPDPEVTPRVLEILARHGAQATFFCIGERALAHPEIVRDIVRAGHAVENHGQRHWLFLGLTGPGAWRREVGGAQAAIAAITGRAPRFYRALAGIRNPYLDPVLHSLGLRLASWSRRGLDTRDGNAQAVYRRLARALAPGDILLLHDGHAARTGAGEPVILEVLPRLLADCTAKGLHPVTLGQACDGH
jgi:peptidoglycan/xylan/chitin deacetylase (PgdA/CDA1 family)